MLAGIGIVFPFIDVIETWFALEYGHEGNPLVRWSMTSLPTGYGWTLFVLYHLALSALAFFLGWKGKSEEAVSYRELLGLLDILEGVLIIGNALLLKFYRVS